MVRRGTECITMAPLNPIVYNARAALALEVYRFPYYVVDHHRILIIRGVSNYGCGFLLAAYKENR